MRQKYETEGMGSDDENEHNPVAKAMAARLKGKARARMTPGFADLSPAEQRALEQEEEEKALFELFEENEYKRKKRERQKVVVVLNPQIWATVVYTYISVAVRISPHNTQ